MIGKHPMCGSMVIDKIILLLVAGVIAYILSRIGM